MYEEYYYNLNEQLDFEDVLLDALPNPIYYEDIKGNFIRCNSSFENLIGTCKEKIIGKSAYDFFPKDVTSRHRLIDKQIMKTLKPYEDEIHFVKKNGTVRYYNLNKAVCLDDDGTIAGIVCIMTDITRRIKEKSFLIQHGKFVKMGELMGAIAHQWNEPLVELSAQVQKIELSYNTDQITKEKVSSFVNDSMRQIQYMSETLNDFKNFLRPSTTKERFGIKKAVEEIFDIVGKQIFYLNIKMVFDCEKEVYIYGYKNDFKQVLLNIINNAKEKIVNLSEESGLKGIITIKVKSGNRYDIVEIMDNAGAIDKKIIGSIFSPFFTTKEDGTGFGLYIAKVIIEDKMSGKISVENRKESVIFKIKVPKKERKNENLTT